jgi:hypothetical protein
MNYQLHATADLPRKKVTVPPWIGVILDTVVEINFSYPDLNLTVQPITLLGEVARLYRTRRFIIVRFHVLKAASIKMAVFWVVSPCSLVEIYRRFRHTCYLHLLGDEAHRPDDGGSKYL